MIRDLYHRLFGATAQARSEWDDGALAIAVLMLQIARSDNFQAAEEIERIDRVLMARFDLDAFGAMRLRKDAMMLEAEAPDTVRFTRDLKAVVAVEDRIGLLVALWEVALADGTRDAHEDQFIRQVSSLLGVSDVDNARARSIAGFQ